ncbi:ATP12 family chaperone protein [Tropicibacter oceani]|uniref:ATP12 family protein n=1 Tax=Tropicibacter oceani TaxID=3058420 RepID=A0ABY8QKV9_9RHOB|nr:ATP12 family protein [Tropicibacter oceani]WGW05255.1 ATP12 family protein [Tropicibacter oceani]
MSEWAPKRFWQNTEINPVEGGFTVLLDGRGVKTPAKTPLIVPTEALAREIAAEWQAQQDKVNPKTMPFTRTANSALDKVATQHAEVADMLAAYGDADLLCYRADHPQELVQRQIEAWDPMLDWAETALGARLEPRSGVIHAPQAPQALTHLARQVHDLNPFALAAFHDLVSMTGSLVLGFAAAHDHLPADQIWQLSRIDETWQEEQWGEDEEATALAVHKRGEFLHASRFFRLVG